MGPLVKIIGSRTLVLLMALGMLATVVAVVPTGSAHYCRGLVPSDCGSCATGDHDHTYCNSFTYDLLSAVADIETGSGLP